MSLSRASRDATGVPRREELSWPSAPFLLIWQATRRWVGDLRSLAIVVGFFVLSIGPLWLGNVLNPQAAAARTDFDPLVVLEPIARRWSDQLFARLDATLMAIPSIKPVFAVGALPPPAGFWTPWSLGAASILAWLAGIAMLPFFIEAVAGLAGDGSRNARYRAAANVVIARVGVSAISFAATYLAFTALPSLLPGLERNESLFLVIQHTVDSLSVPLVALVFMWPFACGVWGLGPLEGLAWTWKAWRRQWRWLLAPMAVLLVLQWIPPGLIAAAKAAAQVNWVLRPILRSAGSIYRFWLDATACACWALLARRFGRNAVADPRFG
jgi:hypothetical protein